MKPETIKENVVRKSCGFCGVRVDWKYEPRSAGDRKGIWSFECKSCGARGKRYGAGNPQESLRPDGQNWDSI